MKTVNLRVPQPFNTGPQYAEDGVLIPSSWPSGLPHEGIVGWIQLGMANGGLSLCEFLCADDWPIDDIPGGWRPNSSMIWDGKSQHYTDEDGVFHNAYTVEAPVNESEYLGHIPDPVDEDGAPTGQPAVYHRMHSFQSWPRLDV